MIFKVEGKGVKLIGTIVVLDNDGGGECRLKKVSILEAESINN